MGALAVGDSAVAITTGRSTAQGTEAAACSAGGAAASARFTMPGQPRIAGEPQVTVGPRPAWPRLRVPSCASASPAPAGRRRILRSPIPPLSQPRRGHDSAAPRWRGPRSRPSSAVSPPGPRRAARVARVRAGASRARLGPRAAPAFAARRRALRSPLASLLPRRSRRRRRCASPARPVRAASAPLAPRRSRSLARSAVRRASRSRVSVALRSRPSPACAVAARAVSLRRAPPGARPSAARRAPRRVPLCLKERPVGFASGSARPRPTVSGSVLAHRLAGIL